MKLSLLAVLGLVSIAALACASIANANLHWYTWLDIASWLLFGGSFIVAFHTRSTVVAAFPISFIVCKFILEDHENYLFNWLYSLFDLSEEYAIQLVIRYITQIALPFFVAFSTAVVLKLRERRLPTAMR